MNSPIQFTPNSCEPARDPGVCDHVDNDGECDNRAEWELQFIVEKNGEYDGVTYFEYCPGHVEDYWGYDPAAT